ncbi:hypothetical protein Mgra_00008396 [Meloidogyne graminicola]|uniref:Uncharacterized protein n=1 Tax=Meloidogyne graminicola TaxID=189291 RepID=A0A8S9ZFZ5_9BILA|nr:hypothetical protein Mgra_00008396 [Meloidogyne graminicola]
MIAETKEDIERYMNLVNSCDVTMDNEGNIILLYSKNSKTMRNGCSIDFVTKKESPILLEFGIQNKPNLITCIKNHTDLLRADTVIPIDNLLSFTFSLKNDEFEQLKNGPKEGQDNDCSNKLECKGKCLKNKVFYSIGWKGWANNIGLEYAFVYIINPVGEGGYDKGMIESTKLLDKTSFNVLFNKEVFRFESKDNPLDLFTYCYKERQKPIKWNIENRTYKDKSYNNLFTFHILPVNAMRTTVQQFLFKCEKDSTNESCKENALLIKCDKMFIKFDKEHFKLLVPPKNNKILKSTTSTIKINGNTTENTNNETKTTKDTTESSSGIGVIIIIVIIIIIMVLFISFLIWLFVFQSTKKEETNTPRLIYSKNYSSSTNVAEGDYTSIKHKSYSGSAPTKDVKPKKGHKTSKFAAGVTVPDTVVDRSKRK